MLEKVSVIIPTLNEESTISTLLSDLAQQQQVTLEVIVVDGGSRDKTCRQVAKFKKVTLLKTHAGVGHQRTLGGQKAKHPFLLFLDADVRLPDPLFIYKMVQVAKKGKLGTVCPYYWPYHSTFIINSIYAIFNVLFFIFQKIWASGAGSGILTTRTVFRTVGGFNSKLRFDDIAYIRAAASKGTFAMAPLLLHVSDRRFRKYGPLKMLAVYLLLSLFFITGRFKAAELIEYKFGEY